MISTALILAALVIGSMGMWRRGARGIAFVCALCAALPAITLAAAAALAGVDRRHLRGSVPDMEPGGPVGRDRGALELPDPAQGRGRLGHRHRPARLRDGDAPPRRHPAARPSPTCPGGSAGDSRPPRSGSGCAAPAWQSVWCLHRGRGADLRRPPGRARPGCWPGWSSTPPAPPWSPPPAPTCSTCAARCARERGPVYVFNAVGLGDIDSTITFDPLTGCADPVTAVERATDMLAATTRGGSGGDREFWDDQARRVLAALLHAAALGAALDGRRARRGWRTRTRRSRQVTALLRRSGEAAFEQRRRRSSSAPTTAPAPRSRRR